MHSGSQIAVYGVLVVHRALIAFPSKGP